MASTSINPECRIALVKMLAFAKVKSLCDSELQRAVQHTVSARSMFGLACYMRDKQVFTLPELKQVFKGKYFSPDNKTGVYSSQTGILIAQTYVGQNGFSLGLLQGVPREEVLKGILKDCPDYCVANNFTKDSKTLLFSKTIKWGK
jgi:hypothetical protein